MSLNSGIGPLSGICDAASSTALQLEHAGAVGVASRARRGLRVWRYLLVAVLGLAVAGTALIEASVASGPTVATVPAAVAAIDTAHGTVPVTVSPADRIAEALVAAEDGSFYSHNGLDAPALVRAALGKVAGSDRGGSTIEMQLAHLAFPAQTAGVWGRIHRVTLALQMDTHFTKPAILSMYLDAAYFGHGFYGIAAASEGYFGVAASRLTWGQAALLAGLVQAPSALDPIDHPAAATARRGYVLQRLADVGALSQTQAHTLARSPLGLQTSE